MNILTTITKAKEIAALSTEEVTAFGLIALIAVGAIVVAIFFWRKNEKLQETRFDEYKEMTKEYQEVVKNLENTMNNYLAVYNLKNK